MRQNAFYASRFHRAFTLVELLTVVIIIGIMATISVSVLTGAMQSARESKTRATIKRIDTAILEIFESYEDRYNEIAAMNFDDVKVQAAFGLANVNLVTDGHRAAIRLHMIRDIMRMEMPSNWEEVYNTNAGGVKLGPLLFNGMADLIAPEPAVLEYYHQAYGQLMSNGGNPKSAPGRAALLYLIVANLNPESLEFFQASEIADTDADGLLEFVDAWGRPIQFLRWAPAFPGSEVQSDVLAGSGHTVAIGDDPESVWAGGPANVADATWKNLTPPSPTTSFPETFKKAFERNPDPVDRYGVQHAWFLYPLIYSAGPDGIADIHSQYLDADDKPRSPTVSEAGVPAKGMLDPFEIPYGYPVDNDKNGVLNHYDNITNHRR